MKYKTIQTLDQLRELYPAPMELAIKKQQSKLDKYSIKFLSLSAFSILSTANTRGHLDCSPRGDYPGFIEALDEHTIAIPDRPGNNRLDSLSNIVTNPEIGLLILVPGFAECLRINGSATVVTDAEILERFRYRDKLPVSVIIVEIRETYFHCAKAIIRSKLWQADAQVDRSAMPGMGEIIMTQIDPSKNKDEIKIIDKLIEEANQSTLY